MDHFIPDPQEKKRHGEAVETHRKTNAKNRRVILCGVCNAAITSPEAKMEMNGSHRHTFFNPHGLMFEIGCFSEASGCSREGPRSDDFTWFPGYYWQTCCCAVCLTHLGWCFSDLEEACFYGLILDRLVETVAGV